ncbi:hypothetical protein SYNPS1DRAFT_28326 [Syncephalis pseudoplumigaleata]|uniref:histidine--tRNA ligase n=1 Tax=Syncephalis pseudoplumigaleata TaxID=1712513 RepID=A0A4V1J1R3_9FUNG|nr:hypothetical protein SYNPS1DRAFT_28326 [Syncephalis pseudoplumigaleata]|eukprot:RKP25959.1 hypothetical protein SYNPS1DRAFT_28326 [Syncephalis pseudoplumigaleata]
MPVQAAAVHGAVLNGHGAQFEQFGVEMFGHQHPSSDVELIEMGWSFVQRLHLPGTAKLEINSIGKLAERHDYIEKLRAYLAANKTALSADSQRRLTENPLRVLDSKAPEDQPIIAGAPRIVEHLTAESRRRFQFVSQMLDALRIPHAVNWRLVRGLDYYNDTVWEIKYADAQLGASQDTILAGGRYDKLVGTLSGSSVDVPAVGWAAGIDRLALIMSQSASMQAGSDTAAAPSIGVVSLPLRATTENDGDGDGDDGALTVEAVNGRIHALAAQTASRIRETGRACIMLHQTTTRAPPIGRILKQAHEMNMQAVVLVGENEAATGQLTVRRMGTREQATCTEEQLSALLARWLDRPADGTNAQ